MSYPLHLDNSRDSSSSSSSSSRDRKSKNVYGSFMLSIVCKRLLQRCTVYYTCGMWEGILVGGMLGYYHVVYCHIPCGMLPHTMWYTATYHVVVYTVAPWGLRYTTPILLSLYLHPGILGPVLCYCRTVQFSGIPWYCATVLLYYCGTMIL